MGEIAIIHMDLMSKGGGEAVAMNVLEALEDHHELRLIALREPDLDELNAYFGTEVEDVEIEVAGWLGPTLYERFGLRFYVLANALLGRYARRRAEDVDLLVSTINELALASPSVHYVHFPFDWQMNLDNREDIFHPTVDDLHERLASHVAGVDEDQMAGNTLLANSGWTADAVEEAYGCRPEILHPPVDTRGFTNRAWDEREEGFVSIGRIEKSKRIVEMIEIVDGVRARGHPVHIHFVGPTVDGEYRRRIEAMAHERDHVFLEGELPRRELVDLICSHRYGLHGKEYEHFGMAVAEIAAGNAIPFIPANGGQSSIVSDLEALSYTDVADAVDKIVRVIDDPALQAELREPFGPKEIRRRFGRERFQRDFRRIVRREMGLPVKEEPRSTPQLSKSSV